MLRLKPTDRKTAWVTVDIVIPVYNEANVLPELLRVLAETFSPEACKQHRLRQVSCLFIDDGSRDESVEIVSTQGMPGVNTSVLRLSRNFGHQAAVSAGIANSSAELVAVIDADLQDPPACILEMVDRWRDGFDVVYARRRNRKEGILKRFSYRAFYRLYSLLSPIAVPADSGDFCLMSRRVVDALNQLPENVRFPRGLRAWVGFPQTALEYDRPARFAGETRYSWADLYRLATDGIASLSLRPLQLAQALSAIYFVLSTIGVAALMLGLFDGADVHAQLSLLIVLMLLSNGIILLCLYILGAYLGRAYMEVKGRPGYVVAEILQVEPGEPLERDGSVEWTE